MRLEVVSCDRVSGQQWFQQSLPIPNPVGSLSTSG